MTDELVPQAARLAEVASEVRVGAGLGAGGVKPRPTLRTSYSRSARSTRIFCTPKRTPSCAESSYDWMLATGSSGCCFGTHAATSFDPAKGCVMLIVVRRSSARSACSLGGKPILSKRADCCSPVDGGVHPGGAIVAEKDEFRASRSTRRPGARDGARNRSKATARAFRRFVRLSGDQGLGP